MTSLLGQLRRMLRDVMSLASGISNERFALVVVSSAVATTALVSSAYGSGVNPALVKALQQLLAGSGQVAAVPTTPGTGAGLTLPPAPRPRPAPAVPTATTAAPSAPPTTTQTTTAPTGPTGPSGPPSPPPAPPPPTPAGTPVKHVFVIALTSPGYDAAFGDQSQMPYLANTLRPQGELLSNYSLLAPSGLSNYVAMVGGQKPNKLTKEDCPTYKEFPAKVAPDKTTGIVPGTGCVYPYEALSIADQVQAAGLRWRAYIEDMANADGPANCIHPASDAADTSQQDSPSHEYVTRHNPFVYFHSLLDFFGCSSNDVPFDQLPADLRKTTTTPNYAFISPNLCDSGSEAQCSDGSPGGAAAADAFLQEWVPQILAAPAYKKDGLLLITFGEAESGVDARSPVGSLILSKFASADGNLGDPYTPYSLLRSEEDLLGLTHLAEANASSTLSFASAIFNNGD